VNSSGSVTVTETPTGVNAGEDGHLEVVNEVSADPVLAVRERGAASSSSGSFGPLPERAPVREEANTGQVSEGTLLFDATPH
jgi:hypothetical protein